MFFRKDKAYQEFYQKGHFDGYKKGHAEGRSEGMTLIESQATFLQQFKKKTLPLYEVKKQAFQAGYNARQVELEDSIRTKKEQKNAKRMKVISTDWELLHKVRKEEKKKAKRKR